MMLTLRPLRLPEDAGSTLKLDTSFDTDWIYTAASSETSFQLTETAAKVSKQYSLKLDELKSLATSHYAIVAAIEGDGESRARNEGCKNQLGEVVGLAAAEYTEWNRRVTLHHLYVDRKHRKMGTGRRLLQSVIDWSCTTPARCVWVETQNTNYPAIQFYRKSGFTLCGFDASLYDSEVTSNESGLQEIGVFLSKPLMRP